MTLLDDGLERLCWQVGEWAHDFRGLALELDADPDAVHRHLDLPAVRYLSTLTVPPEWGGEPVVAGGRRFHGMTALERVVVTEELACADAGMLLASPGPSMSGVLVDLLADDEQKKWFYGRILDRPQWTFFALTEPDHGSDATALRTRLSPDGLLDGAKRYIGNATRATVGVVFARTGPGPLGITAVLVDTCAPGYSATPLDMLGLRGARISEMALSGIPIPQDRVLGRHLSPARRGTWAFLQTFNRLRPGVAAIALGIARAAYEYVTTNRSCLPPAQQSALDRLRRRIDGTRALVHLAASTVDAKGDAGYVASAAKAKACRLAEEATLEACGFFGPGARLDHPLLDKLCRDARGVEFMEGTGNMQKLNLFQGLIKGKLDHPTP
jgi:alkylation response protein AidB-like acyl-CoA dehydrogenase